MKWPSKDCKKQPCKCSVQKYTIDLFFFSVDTNLIQLEPDDVLATNTNATYADNDDDIIFEVKQNLAATI